MITKHALWVATALTSLAQTAHVHQEQAATVPLQPLAQQVRQLEEAMTYLGQPFGAADLRRIHEAIANPDEAAAVHALDKADMPQAFALEISHHVRKKMLGVSSEAVENVVLVLPKASAQRLVASGDRASRGPLGGRPEDGPR